MAIIRESIDVPYRDQVVSGSGLLTEVWSGFFRSLFDRVYPLGVERSFQLENDQDEAANIEGMKVNARGVSFAIVEYLVQRITEGESATQLIESGVFKLTYMPDDEEWSLDVIDDETPDDAGVTFSVTADGQVQYTSSEITGDPVLSRIFWRMRTIGGKSTIYSSVGVRS